MKVKVGKNGSQSQQLSCKEEKMIYVSRNGFLRGIETNEDGDIIRSFGFRNVLVCDAEGLIESEELEKTDRSDFEWDDFDFEGLRKTTGMTQKQIADYFDVPVRSWQEWEQGRKMPPAYVLKMMVRIWKLEK